MSTDGVIGFGYLQARVQARYAQLASNALWSQLAAIDEFSAYLEEGRETSLSPLISSISAQSDSHDIDSALRRVFLHHIIELSNWMPHAWRPASLWLQWLPNISLLSYLLSQQPPYPWMYHEKSLFLLLGDQDINIGQALQKAGADCLISEGTSATAIFSMWLQQWTSLWPAWSHSLTHGVEDLIQLLEKYQKKFTTLSSHETWAARDTLQQTLRLFFRRNLLQPATAYAYLALMSLQLERLRAELLQRLLFTQKSSMS
jgi:hypothetical protein